MLYLATKRCIFDKNSHQFLKQFLNCKIKFRRVLFFIMLEVIIYIVIGVTFGGLVVWLYARAKRNEVSLDSSSSNQQVVIDLESNLRIANDRLQRAEIEQQKLHEELSQLAKLKEQLVTEHSSALTRLDEIQKQNAKLQQESSVLKEEITKKIDQYQEVTRNLSSFQIKSQNQQEQIDSFTKSVEEYKKLENQLRSELAQSREKVVELDKENKYQKQLLDEQKVKIDEIGQKFASEFKLLADQILEDKSKRFTEMNQTNLERLLKPLGENISVFQKKVEEVYSLESKERFSLGKEVEKLVQLNQRISEEASNLTNALKGQVKQQGNWGEMILESILEKSGLVKDREYFVQESLKDEEGKRLQPDVIIVYPDERRVVIDSKVSLVAYERYASAKTPDEQEKALQEHLRSIKAHIDALSSKSYQDLVDSLDFVMMFVAVEPAFMLAMQSDQDLWSYAYTKRVLLISPTNLIAALKLIYDLWKREHQNRNAVEIAERGGQLYDKFVSFVENLKVVGDSLEKSQKSFNSAMGQLTDGRGNIISQVQKLKDLGAKAKKTLPSNLWDSNEELPENTES